MNSKQQLIVTLGLFLLGLTIWFEWSGEIKTILFNAPIPHDKSGSSGGNGGISGQLPNLTPGQLHDIFGGAATSPTAPPNPVPTVSA